MNPGTLCAEEWIALLVLIVAVVGNWLWPAGMGAERVRKYYNNYCKLKREGYIALAPPAWLFGIMWALIYALLVPAIFLVYYYDDACTGPPGVARWDYRLELAVWVLILVNLVLNKSWDIVITGRYIYYAELMAAIVTSLVTLTAIAIAILLFILAADSAVSNCIYFSAAVYSLYSLWGLFASYLGVAKFFATAQKYGRV